MEKKGKRSKRGKEGLLEIITAIGPLLIALVIYFVRLEKKLMKISTDLCWIKKELKPCLPTSEKSSR